MYHNDTVANKFPSLIQHTLLKCNQMYHVSEAVSKRITTVATFKEGHSKCTDLTPCFSLSFHHKYTQLPVMLSIACFYITLSAWKFKNMHGLFF